MKPRNAFVSATLLAAGLALCPLRAAEVKTLVKALMPVPSTAGNEAGLAAEVRKHLPSRLRVSGDGLGGLEASAGEGGTELLILAPLDDYGFIVSGITPDGYIRLDRPVPAPHPLFDGYLLGQPVLIATARGALQGVVAQPAAHLLTPERRRELVDGFSLDDAYIDIAARSEAEVRSRGVELLDAVVLWPHFSELAGGNAAGTSLAQKTLCAMLTEAAGSLAKPAGGGKTVLVWAAQTKFPARGRGPRAAVGAVRARNRHRPARALALELVPAGKDGQGPSPGKGPVLVAPTGPSGLYEKLKSAADGLNMALQVVPALESLSAAGLADRDSDVVTLALPVEFLHTPSELINWADVEAAVRLLKALISGGRDGGAK